MTKQGTVYEGKTLDDAVRKGLDALGLARAEAMITVVDEGSGGFLGLGAKPYRVRIMPRPGGPPRETGDGEGRSRRGRRPERAGSDRNGGRHGRGPQGAPRRDDRSRGGEPRREPREGDRPATAAPPREEDSSERGRRRRRRSGGRDGERREAPALADRPNREDRPAPRDREERPAPRGREERPAPRDREERPAMRDREERPAFREREEGPAPRDRYDRPAAAERRSERPPRPERPASTATPELSPTELEDAGRQFLTDLLKLMGFQGTVDVKADGTRLETRVSVGEDETLLAGKKGEVRQAIQHLLNRALNRGEGARYHVQVEINDFWQKREQELQQLARDLAEEALTRQGEAVTEYLNAQERRIIHVTLRDDTRVKTYALGTGMIKRVAIAPADFPGGEEPDR